MKILPIMGGIAAAGLGTLAWGYTELTKFELKEYTLPLSDGTSAAPPPSSNGGGQGAEAARTGTGGANSAPSGNQQQQPAPEPLIRQEDIDAVANDIRSFFGL